MADARTRFAQPVRHLRLHLRCALSGPAQFGALNYLLATIAIVVPLVQLGADSIIFNRVARRQPSGIRLMLASIRLRRWLFLAVTLPILTWSYFSQSPASQLMTLLLLVSAYFSIQDVYKIYYDARLQSKRNTLINNLALLLSIGLRLALVSAALPLVWFAVPTSSAAPYLTWRASGYSVGKLRPRRGLRRARPGAMAVICSRWACRWPSPACR